ncbi:MAG: class I SAM-dependent methyltransferase [Gemmatimonadales bacterium]
MRLRTPRAWRRARRALAGLAAAGIIGILLGLSTWGPAVFAGGLLGLVLLETSELRRTIHESRRQHYAHTQIRPLMGAVPLDLSGWAADPVMVHNTVRLLVDVRPGLVVECGSGSSTVMIARCLQSLRSGRVISLDHDADYARRTSELLHLNGLEEVATVITAPLVEREMNGQRCRWYSRGYESLINQPIEILVVDGPPGSSGPRARYPAIPLLKSRLAPDCWIIMDDGDRIDEQAIARLWADDLPATLTYLEGGRGGWLLRRQPVGASGSR